MENRYWIGRMRDAMSAARAASTSEARLIHYDLAGRYSLKAAVALPFLAARSVPAADAARPTLHLRDPATPSLAAVPALPEPPGRLERQAPPASLR